MACGRSYFAWRMMEEAAESDRRDGERRQNIKRRKSFCISRISETHFIQRYRLSKAAFVHLCDTLRQFSTLRSSQRVTLEIKVLSALLFYAHGDYQRVVGIANNVSQAAISRYVADVTNSLNNSAVISKFIKFPDIEAQEKIKTNFYNTYGIPGVVGCVDGSHFAIYKPHKNEEHLYYSRKHYHSLNVQMTADHSYKITSINAKFGGACHDAFVWENSNLNTHMQRLHENGQSVWLLGDSGYPQRPWLMTPYNNPEPGSAAESFNSAHRRARVIIENTFGRLKNRWRCLCKHRTLHYSPTKCAKIITACCVLHNLAIDFGIPYAYDEQVTTAEPNVIDMQAPERELALLTLGRIMRDRLASRIHNNL